MSSRAIPFEELCDPEFLQSVERLRWVARRVPAGGRYADQRSVDLGHGLEFRDFRPYAPGDDLRSVDWNIYRRLGRVFVRLFEEMEDLPLYVLPDVSASMFLEDPPRAKAGLRAAVALSAISLDQHDTVSLMPFGEDLEVLTRSTSGSGRIFTVARRLADLEPRPGTDLARSLRRIQGLRLRRGLLAVISDFFDPGGLDAVLGAFRGVQHRLLLVQCVRQSDAAPAVEGDLRLRDCETGRTEDVSVTRPVLEAYRRAYDRFQDGLAEFARKRGAGLVRLDTDRAVVPQLAELFEAGRFTV